MKRKLLLSILMLVFVASVLVACNSEQAPEGIKVTFDLQGGEYRTSTSAVEVYYNYPDGAKRVIKPLGDLSKKEVTRSKYDLVGWYKSISEDGTFDQADLWDFASDEIAADGSTTLYAGWKEKTNYSYTLYYRDETDPDKLVSLGKISVEENEPFYDLDGVSKRSGYTLLRYTESDGTVRGDDGAEGKRPSGETLNVDIICEYIKGTYTIVSTPDDFATAFGFANIYLTTDIDMNGRSLVLPTDIRNKNITGDKHHTVSNFSVLKLNNLGFMGKGELKADIENPDQKSFYGSMFRSMTNCNFDNVTFDNVSVRIAVAKGFETNNIYIAPLSAYVDKCNFNNVVVNYNVTYGTNVDETKVIKPTTADALFVSSDETTTVTSCTGTITYQQGE